MEQSNGNGVVDDCREEVGSPTCEKIREVMDEIKIEAVPSSPSSDKEVQVDGACGLAYKTDEEGSEGSDKAMRTCVLKMLDELEERVEKLRADALKMEAERDDVLTSLDTLKNSELVHTLNGIDLDEVNRYATRLTTRAAAVRVVITSEKSRSQEESLSAVNALIDALVLEIKSDVTLAKRKCISYLNSCSDESDLLFQRSVGIDARFEQAVLGCTIEDQKRVKKRLNGLYSYFQTYKDDILQASSSASSLTKIEEEK